MSKSIAAHLDPASLQLLKEISATENRPVSQIVSVPLRLSLRMSPAVRRALFAIDGSAREEEQALATKIVGRSILRSYEAILEQRYLAAKQTGSNSPLDGEEKIEAEAVRLTMR